MTILRRNNIMAVPQPLRRSLLLVCAAAALLAACGGSWQEVAPPEGGFSVMMHATPRFEKSDIETPMGTITGHWYAVEVSESVFGVGYSDYPQQVVANVAPKWMFTTVRESWVKRINGKLVGEGEEIRLDRLHPGMDFSARGELRGYEVLLRGQLYLVGNRLYQVIVFGRRETLPRGDIHRFLASFKLVPRHDVARVKVDPKQ
jgi:hypothetical protein